LSFDGQELDRRQARGWLEKDMYFTANPGKIKSYRATWLVVRTWNLSPGSPVRAPLDWFLSISQPILISINVTKQPDWLLENMIRFTANPSENWGHRETWLVVSGTGSQSNLIGCLEHEICYTANPGEHTYHRAIWLVVSKIGFSTFNENTDHRATWLVFLSTRFVSQPILVSMQVTEYSDWLSRALQILFQPDWPRQ
jgi:hypothetical protein